MFERKAIKPEHKKILNKIRELYIQSCGKPICEPEVQKVENNKNKNKKGKLDHDVAMKLYNIGFNDQMIGDRLDITRDMIRKWREKNNLPANRTHKRSFKHIQ